MQKNESIHAVKQLYDTTFRITQNLREAEA